MKQTNTTAKYIHYILLATVHVSNLIHIWRTELYIVLYQTIIN